MSDDQPSAPQLVYERARFIELMGQLINQIEDDTLREEFQAALARMEDDPEDA